MVEWRVVEQRVEQRIEQRVEQRVPEEVQELKDTLDYTPPPCAKVTLHP